MISKVATSYLLVSLLNPCTDLAHNNTARYNALVLCHDTRMFAYYFVPKPTVRRSVPGVSPGRGY